MSVIQIITPNYIQTNTIAGIRKMSNFFTKNRQQKWQRKQTAINSHNDQFTIYAQMNHPSTSSSYVQHMDRDRQKQRGGVESRGSCGDTPISDERIWKMREMLRNFENMNVAEGKSTPIELNYSQANSIHNSRNTNPTTQQHNRSHQRQQKQPYPKHPQPQPQQYPYQQPQYPAPQQPVSPVKSEYQQQQQQQIDYNRKLDQMKQRLEIICKKEWEYNKVRDSPQTSLKSKNSSSKATSQLSTTRHPTRTNNPPRHNKQYNKVQDHHSIYAAKNTVPMPTIIHEHQDDQQLDQQYRIVSSTVQLQQYPSRNKYKNPNIDYQDSDLQHPNPNTITNTPTYNIKPQHHPHHPHNHYPQQHRYNLPNNSSNNSSYGNTLSHKKSTNGKDAKLQYYYQLFPSYSEELDMKVYKYQQQGHGQVKMQMQERATREELDSMGGSIWIKPNNNNNNNTKHNNSQQISKVTHNQSNKSTKRRDSTANIANRNRAISQQQPNMHNQLTKSKSKTKIPNTSTLFTKDTLNKSKSKIPTNITITNPNSNNPKPIHKKQPPLYIEYQSRLTPQHKNKSNPHNTHNPHNLLQQPQITKHRLHRAPLRELLVFGGGQDCVHMYSAAADYMVKYHVHHLHTGNIDTYDLYRHRGGVTSLMKIDNILFSTSTDLYLKYSTLTPSPSLPSCPPSLSNQYMYKLPTTPYQLVCVNQQNLLIGCTDKMYLFDVGRCQIAREIDMGMGVGMGGGGGWGRNGGRFQILENGHSLYVGGRRSLDMVDFRCSNPIVNVCGDLPYVENWIMHPIEQYCLINTNNQLLKLDFRSPNLLNSTPLPLPAHQTITNHCWPIPTPSLPSCPQLFNNPQPQQSLLLLTEQQTSPTTRINRLIKLYINNNSYYYQFLSLSEGDEERTRVVNSMNIVREYSGIVYVGDKMGYVGVRDCWGGRNWGMGILGGLNGRGQMGTMERLG